MTSIYESRIDLLKIVNITSPQDIKILDWCPAGPVLRHMEKVPL